AAGSLAAVTACSASNAAATRLYTYPGNPLFAEVAQLRGSGHQAEAAALKAVAETPSGIWVAGQPGEMQEARRATLAANAAIAVPVIGAYNLPGRDACGKLSASVGPAASAYETWVNQLAAAIGTGDDIVIVEPDGLPDAVRGCLS